MNAKISMFFICIEAIVYLLLYNLHDCTFNFIKFETRFNQAIHTVNRLFTLTLMIKRQKLRNYHSTFST